MIVIVFVRDGIVQGEMEEVVRMYEAWGEVGIEGRTEKFGVSAGVCGLAGGNRCGMFQEAWGMCVMNPHLQGWIVSKTRFLVGERRSGLFRRILGGGREEKGGLGGCCSGSHGVVGCCYSSIVNGCVCLPVLIHLLSAFQAMI